MILSAFLRPLWPVLIKFRQQARPVFGKIPRNRVMDSQAVGTLYEYQGSRDKEMHQRNFFFLQKLRDLNLLPVRFLEARKKKSGPLSKHTNSEIARLGVVKYSLSGSILKIL